MCQRYRLLNNDIPQINTYHVVMSAKMIVLIIRYTEFVKQMIVEWCLQKINKLLALCVGTFFDSRWIKKVQVEEKTT